MTMTMTTTIDNGPKMAWVNVTKFKMVAMTQLACSQIRVFHVIIKVRQTAKNDLQCNASDQSILLLIINQQHTMLSIHIMN